MNKNLEQQKLKLALEALRGVVLIMAERERHEAGTIDKKTGKGIGGQFKKTGDSGSTAQKDSPATETPTEEIPSDEKYMDEAVAMFEEQFEEQFDEIETEVVSDLSAEETETWNEVIAPSLKTIGNELMNLYKGGDQYKTKFDLYEDKVNKQLDKREDSAAMGDNIKSKGKKNGGVGKFFSDAWAMAVGLDAIAKENIMETLTNKDIKNTADLQDAYSVVGRNIAAIVGGAIAGLGPHDEEKGRFQKMREKHQEIIENSRASVAEAKSLRDSLRLKEIPDGPLKDKLEQAILDGDMTPEEVAFIVQPKIPQELKLRPDEKEAFNREERERKQRERRKKQREKLMNDVKKGAEDIKKEASATLKKVTKATSEKLAEHYKSNSHSANNKQKQQEPSQEG